MRYSLNKDLSLFCLKPRVESPSHKQLYPHLVITTTLGSQTSHSIQGPVAVTMFTVLDHVYFGAEDCFTFT